MAYYVELTNGERKAVNEWVYRILLAEHDYYHLIRLDSVEIIKGHKR